MTVCITGLGAVTASGMGAPALRDAMLRMQSGVAPCPALHGAAGAVAPALERTAATRRLDRSAALFFAAAEEGWRDAGLDDAAIDRDRCAVIEGSSLGPMTDLLTTHRARLAEGERWRAKPSGLVRFMPGAGGSAFGQTHDLHGLVYHLSAGSVSATLAIAEAFHKVTSGAASWAVAGGAECPLDADVADNFRAAGLLASDRGCGTCRPFDRRRSGTLLGEGAGVLILESLEHAATRGAHVYALVTGTGFSSEGYSMTAPDPEGAGVTAAIRTALREARATRVDWIKTHGTGTPAGDAAECRGVAAVFGSGLRDIPLTGLKSTVGHCLGASGAVEAVAAALALDGGFVPATLATKEIDPELPPCRVVTQVEESPAETVLLLAESFGGRCAAVVLTALGRVGGPCR